MKREPGDGADWHDQERPAGATAQLGEIGMGALAAIAMQAFLSSLAVGVWAINTGAQSPGQVGWPLTCAACGQFVWLFPAFIIVLWWRPGFAGGLAFGAMFGAALGIGLACLYGIVW